ncbi:MAG: recombinase family protein [Oligoflexales bacterium]
MKGGGTSSYRAFRTTNFRYAATSKGQNGIVAAFAEFESSLIRERVKAGIENAKAKGKTLGDPGRNQKKLSCCAIKFFLKWLLDGQMKV